MRRYVLKDVLRELLDHLSVCLRARAPANKGLMKWRGMWREASTLTDVKYNETVGAEKPGQEGGNGYLAFPQAGRSGCATRV